MDEVRTRQSFWLVLAALAAIVVRSPKLLLHGRVFQEEGSVYFQCSLDQPWWKALVAVHQGYYSLLMNVTTLVADKLLRMEQVAFSFTFVALLVQLLTVYLAVECEIFKDLETRALAATMVVFAPALEVWLTLEDAQFVLAVGVGLICVSSVQRLGGLRTAVVLLAGLTGPPSCAFAPFFLWQAYRERTVWRVAQAAILSGCALLQAALLYLSLRAGNRPPTSGGKWEWFGPILFMKIFAVSFFTRLGAFLSQRIVIHHGNVIVCLGVWALTLAMVGLFWKVASANGSAGKLLVLLALGSLVFNFFGIGEPLDEVFIGAWRYFYTGLVLFWMALLAGYAGAKQSGLLRERKLAFALVWVVLVCGGIDAAGYWGRLQRLDPRWSEQVAAWRRDPSKPIFVAQPLWPYPIRIPPSGHR